MLAFEGGWQPKRTSDKHLRAIDNSDGQHHHTTAKQCSVFHHNTSASSLTDKEHHLYGMDTTNSLPQSVYRSYDVDILSCCTAGEEDLDKCDPLLLIAPSADWIGQEANKQHCQHSLKQFSSKSCHNQSHSPKLLDLPDSDTPPRLYSSSQLNQGMAHIFTLSPEDRHNPDKSTMCEVHQSQQSYPVTTPFAKYTPVSRSHSVKSQDLDTSMQRAAQAWSKRPNAKAVCGIGKPPNEQNEAYRICAAAVHAQQLYCVSINF